MNDFNSLHKYKELLENCNILLLQEDTLKYFGILACAFKKIILTPEQSKKFIGSEAVAFTDGDNIYYIVDESHNALDLIFLTIHELLHIMSNHVDRIAGRDPILWNLACDHVVNRLLYDMSKSNTNKYIKYMEQCFLIKDLHKDNPDIECEMVYEFIVQNKNRFSYKNMTVTLEEFSNLTGAGGGGKEEGEGEGEGDGENSSGEGDENKKENSDNGNSSSDIKINIIEVTDKKTGNKYYITNDTNTNSNNPKNKDQQDVKRKLDEIKNNASIMWNSDELNKTKGNCPGSLLKHIKSIFEIKIPWDKILENSIKYSNQNVQEVDWTWPNMYIRSPRLPGYNNGESFKTMVAVIDSSGSISDKNLEKFVGVICSSSGIFENIHVIIHDHCIQDEYFIEDVTSKESIINKIPDIPGRGGTSHRDVFNRIDELFDEHDISTIVFLTDFYSDVEAFYSQYSWMKSLDTIWAIVDRNPDFKVELLGCKTITINI